MGHDEVRRERLVAAEKRIAGVRLVVILSGTILYPFVLDHEGTIPWLAYALLGLAWAYGLYVFVQEPYRRHPILLSSHFTSASDAGLTMLWLYATGGFESPFYVALYVAIVGVAFRYPVKETLVAAAIYMGGYVALLGLLGEFAPHWQEVAVRVTYLGLATALGLVMSHEVEYQTRLRHEKELLAAETEAARERLLESEERLAEAQRLSHVGSFEWDAGRDRTTWSNEMYRIHGMAPESLAPTYAAYLGYVHPDDCARFHGAIQASLASGKAFEHEYRFVRADGSHGWVHARGEVLPGPGGSGPPTLRGYCQDITERKAAERVRDEALQRIADLERLKEIHTFTTRFLNMAAHELATPLTPIKLQLYLMEKRLLRVKDAELHASHRVLARSFDRLARLVNDLLDASRLHAAKLGLRREAADLNQIAQDAVNVYEPAAKEAGVGLDAHYAALEPVDADVHRISQVLVNLLSNALKFTPRGGRVHVETVPSGDSAAVMVHDTGTGLAGPQIERLFQPFSQVHEAVAPAAGTGLGLYIARGIVELHGGRIWVESPGPGQGSTFGFTVPFASIAPRAQVAAPRSAAHRKGRFRN